MASQRTPKNALRSISGADIGYDIEVGGPTRILELGTFTGYSALCLAEGLSEGGELITVDKNEELEDMACSFFGRSPYRGMIKMDNWRCHGRSAFARRTVRHRFYRRR